ncbi:MAG: thioredoxin family protein [Candidatus Thorarchaeota archaeon]|jgi:thioredoxin 1
MLNDDDLAEIRRRKMELLMERAKKAQEPQLAEPLSKGIVVELTDTNFWETIQQTKNALIDFYGEWCYPCKTLAPIVAELAQEYSGKLFFGKIDIDRNPRTTAQFGVQSVPMVVAFKNGNAIGKIPGLRKFNDYDNVAQQMVAN